MPAIFIFKKEPPKIRNFFIFLRGRNFIMGGPIDMNADAFWETSVSFLESVVLQFPQNIAKVMSIWMSKIDEKLTGLKIKVDSHLPKKITFCINWNPFKKDKNAFYFILKAFFVLKIFKFLSWFFGHLEKATWLETHG